MSELINGLAKVALNMSSPSDKKSGDTGENCKQDPVNSLSSFKEVLAEMSSGCFVGETRSIGDMHYT